jgi:exodeoxyribonuclease V alpha subunit
MGRLNQEHLAGSVERITYYNPENGYSVVRLRPDHRKTPGMNRDGLVTVTGNLPELSPGVHLNLTGRWTTHTRHGLQFQADMCEQTMPASLAGIRRYLSSGLIRGIGPQLAERIVIHFGDRTLEIIENHPERLRQVPDIGPKRLEKIIRAWEDQKQIKEIMLFLHSHGITTNLAVKIYKQYGRESFEVVQGDPYRLAQDIRGVGFKTADQIAQALGLPRDHPARIEAGLVYALNQMSDDGHVFSPYQQLLEHASALLEVPGELVPPLVEKLVQQERLCQEVLPFLSTSDLQKGENKEPGGLDQDDQSSIRPGVREPGEAYGQPALYLPPFYFSEIGIANRLQALAFSWPTRLSDLPPQFAKLDASLSAEQRQAIHTTLSHPVSVLTGGPGTGKTTAMRALIAVLAAGGKTFALASPTGRAAKRLAEATGHPASTIHRLLGFSPGEGFKHNPTHPLDVDLLVIDEASMLDLLLANHLLKAVTPGTHLLLVGDVDQLPSVGAGDVLRDIIASDLVPVTRLNQIFRQPPGSHIVTNAHRINQGKIPLFQAESRDFFLFQAETPEEAARWVEDVVIQRIPQKFGLDPIEQVQVLAPMYRGLAGVNALNGRLQAALNPPSNHKAEKSLIGQIFRVGDKVMQTVNNYDKDVFNGDIGRVNGLDVAEQQLIVNFEGRRVCYDWSEADQLVLAYAISVHKAQGSEFPAVVIPLVTAHYLMLQRNLFYTAITRARQLCVLVGSRRAIGLAVRSNKVSNRYSALDWRLSTLKKGGGIENHPDLRAL